MACDHCIRFSTTSWRCAAEMVIGLSLLSHTADQFTGTALYAEALLRGLAGREELELEVLCNPRTAPAAAQWAGSAATITVSGRATASRLGRVARLLASRAPGARSFASAPD